MALFKLRLPRLPQNWQDQPQLFERYWDDAMTQLEKSLNAILEIPSLQDAIQQAQLAADNANQAAEGLSQQTTAQAREQSLINSYVTGITLTADTAGLVTISSHQRVYGDQSLNPTVTVNGSSISTGKPAGSVIRIYYDDPERDGGSVSYQFTTDPSDPPVQTGDRHSVGVVTVPAVGQPDDEGDYVKPPGYVPRRPNENIQ